MAKAELTVDVHVRWWVVPYLQTLGFICAIFRKPPDETKVARFVARHGVSIKVRHA